ncbi:heme exporter protein CcmD [bacterium]|nr:heme exporter protein CcmD [bacterium]
MPDLGKYAVTVLSAYGAAIALLVVLVAVTLWQGARMKRLLEDVERREGKN